MRISKELARSITKRVLEAKSKKVEKLKTEFREYITAIAEKKIPAKLMEVFKSSNAGFIKTSSSLYLDGKGFNRVNASATRSIPCKDGYYINVNLTDTEATKAKALHNEFLKAKEKYDQLENELEAALLNLKTFNRIQNELPEAAKHLPQGTTLAVAVNLDKLRKEIAA